MSQARDNALEEVFTAAQEYLELVDKTAGADEPMPELALLELRAAVRKAEEA